MAWFLGIGATIVDNVLTEAPGIARLPVSASVAGGLMALQPGVTFGPVSHAVGTIGAFGLFSAPSGGSMQFGATCPPVFLAAGGSLSFPAGAYGVIAVAAGPDVMTTGADPILAAGQPLQRG